MNLTQYKALFFVVTAILALVGCFTGIAASFGFTPD